MIYPDDIMPNGFVKGRYIQARKKYIYYNNGIDNFKFLDGETIPPFLIKGKIKIIKNKRVYICDNFGNIRWIASEEDIPESYHILSKDEKIKFFSRK